MSASITYAGYAFHEAGSVTYGLARAYESAPDGIPSAIDLTWTVKLAIARESFADVERALASLRAVLDSQPEGLLVIRDEHGHLLHSLHARVVSDTVPDEWRQYLGEITVVLAARDPSVGASAAGAVWTPAGGAPVDLPGVSTFSESIRTERHHQQKIPRLESRLVVDLSGRVSADPALSESDRRAWLIARRAAIQDAAAVAPDGSLTWGGETRAFQVDTLGARFAGDGSTTLEWSATLSRLAFPEDEYAEATFEATATESKETGEIGLVVAGVIRASTQAEAINKQESILAYYAPGRALVSVEASDALASGRDTGDDMPAEWCERRFTLTFRDIQASVLNWELQISTTLDRKTGLDAIVYSGRVIAATSAAALAKARELGRGKHPFAISDKEDLSWRKMGDGAAERFIECSFSYDYASRGSRIYAEVSSVRSRDTFGSWTIAVSGHAIAATSGAAETLGRSFKLASSYLQTADSETTESHHSDGTPQFQRFAFSYAWLIPSDTLSLDYSRSESSDFESLETRIAFEGVARGASKAACAAYVASVIAQPSGSRKTAESFTEQYKREGAKQILDGYRFSYAYVGDLASGAAPGNIVEGEVSLERTFSVNQAILTPIPYGQPHVQASTGITPGSARITGHATGYSESALRSWARGHRSSRPGGGHEQPGSETVTRVIPKFKPEGAKLYRITFSYAWQYARLDM